MKSVNNDLLLRFVYVAISLARTVFVSNRLRRLSIAIFKRFIAGPSQCADSFELH